MQALTKKVLCFGGSGALGSNLLRILPSPIYAATNVDFKKSESAQNNILLDSNTHPKDTLHKIKQSLSSEKFDAIVVTAGGWVGGSIKSDNLIQQYEQMRDMNLVPSLFAAHLATKYLNDKGLVVFTGAAAVFQEPQPEMIAYALAKTGVHSLALNLSLSKDVPEATTVLTILPQTIDTPANRESMPKANFDEWSKPIQIAELVKGWIDGLNRPSTGSFMVLKVKNGAVVPEFV